MAVTGSVLTQTGHQMVEDDRGRFTYEGVSWEVRTNDPTDSPGIVLLQARALTPGPGVDPVAARGSNYDFGGTTDVGAYAKQFSVVKDDPANLPTRWTATARYAPLVDGETEAKLTEADPLLWPVEIWIDWVEEQVVLESALNLDDLTHVGRPPNTQGPVINAAGEKFTVPPMHTIYHPIVNFQKNYATADEVFAINAAYQGTVNNAIWKTFPLHTAKFLTADSGRIQKIGASSFYATVIRVEVNYKTWDIELLNNGFNSWNTTTTKVEEILVDDPKFPGDDDRQKPTAEPKRLAIDGTRLSDELPATFLKYRDLDPADYSLIPGIQ